MAAEPGSNIRCSDICVTVTRSIEPAGDPAPGSVLREELFAGVGTVRWTLLSVGSAAGMPAAMRCSGTAGRVSAADTGRCTAGAGEALLRDAGTAIRLDK